MEGRWLSLLGRALPPPPSRNTPWSSVISEAIWDRGGGQQGRCEVGPRSVSQQPRPRQWFGALVTFLPTAPGSHSRMVYAMCDKEMTIRSLLWFGHSSRPPGSPRLWARTGHKSWRCSSRGTRPPPFPCSSGWTLHPGPPGARGDSAPLPHWALIPIPTSHLASQGCQQTSLQDLQSTGRPAPLSAVRGQGWAGGSQVRAPACSLPHPCHLHRHPNYTQSTDPPAPGGVKRAHPPSTQEPRAGASAEALPGTPSSPHKAPLSSSIWWGHSPIFPTEMPPN